MIQTIAAGRTDRVFDHLAAGGGARDCDDQGVSLLAWCAYHGDVSAMRLLLRYGAALVDLGANYDLNGAVFHGHWRLCQFLIEHGADVNHALPDTGETPLHAALCKANRPVYERIVEILLEAGADPQRTTKPDAATGAFMRDCRTKAETPLHRAAAFGSERSIQLLLDAGAAREAHDMHGDTPLSWASWHLRPAAILRQLCYGDHRIHPDNASTYDHGSGW